MRKILKYTLFWACAVLVFGYIWSTNVTQDTWHVKGEQALIKGKKVEFTSDAVKVDDWWMVQIKEVE